MLWTPGEHVGLLHLRPRLLLWGARILRQGRVGARAGGLGHGGLVGARVAGRVVATYGRAIPAVQGADQRAPDGPRARPGAREALRDDDRSRPRADRT